MSRAWVVFDNKVMQEWHLHYKVRFHCAARPLLWGGEVKPIYRALSKVDICSLLLVGFGQTSTSHEEMIFLELRC